MENKVSQQKLISFICAVKNESRYIRQLYDSLVATMDEAWEFIVVDDGSSDDTFEIIIELGALDHRVKAYKSLSEGKVFALNYAFSKTEGEIIKSIDGDDLIEPSLCAILREVHSSYDAMYHPLQLSTERLEPIGVYSPNPRIASASIPLLLTHFVTIPKACWSFSRSIATAVFPISEKAPYEDAWLTFKVKIHANKILFFKHPLYKYRQHSNQTFGNIFDYSPTMVHFRAARNVSMIACLRDLEEFLPYQRSLDAAEVDFFYLLDKVGGLEYFFSQRPFNLKVRNILIKNFPRIMTLIQFLRTKRLLSKSTLRRKQRPPKCNES